MGKYLDYNGLKKLLSMLKNSFIAETINKELTLNEDSDGNTVKSETYQKVENIVDSKMKWLSEFPE